MYQEIIPAAVRVSTTTSFEVANPGAGHVQVVHSVQDYAGEVYEKVVIYGRYGDSYVQLCEGLSLTEAGSKVYGLGPLASASDGVHGQVFAGLVPSVLYFELVTLVVGETDWVKGRVEVHWLGVP
jgi:hypothetical protein